MGALKNAIIDRSDVAVPYPVNLFDPPVETPAYGDEDVPRREGLTFVEYLAHLAEEFRYLGTKGGQYLAGAIQAKVRLCEEHGIEHPAQLVRHEISEADRIAEDYARLLGRAERAEAELARRND